MKSRCRLDVARTLISGPLGTMITKRGVGFVLAAVAVFFIASSTRVGWAHIADAVLWGAILLSAMAPWATILGLKATRVFKTSSNSELDGPAAGDEATIELVVTNRWWLPRFLVSATAPITTNGQRLSPHRALLSVVKGRTGAVSYSNFALTSRGVLKVGDITLESSAPFGLFRKRKSFRKKDRVLVYPRSYAISSFAPPTGASQEESVHGRSRTGIEIAGSRRYVYGDARRNVHWRNSARTGHLMVKEFDSQQGRPFAFVFITSRQPGQEEAARVEEAISVVASVARPVLTQGRHVFLVGRDGLNPAFLSWQALMSRLAVIHHGDLSGGELVLDQLSANTHVLALVTDANPVAKSTLKSIGRFAESTTAVVFGESGDSAITAAEIEGLGVRTICCRPGEIGTLLKALESPLAPRTSVAQRERLAVGA